MEDILRKFDHRVKNLDSHIISLLAEIDGIRGELKSGLRMTPQAISSLRKSTLVSSAGASTRIEGSSLTDAKVQKIMQGLAISRFADRDSQEVQGYLETLQNVFDGYTTLSLRENVIMALHKQLLKYSTKDDTHRGGYKKKENVVGVLGPNGQVVHVLFQTTPAYLTSKEMQELVLWTNEALEKERFHQLLIVANFIVEFLKIHPFEDGNGRLSRVLTNLLLLRFGYHFVQYVSHEQIVERRKDEYYLALRRAQKTFGTPEDTISPWLNFFLSVVKEQGTTALQYLTEEHIENTLSVKQQAVWKYIASVGEAAPREIVLATGIGNATVRQALEKLEKFGKIKRIGQGRATRYVKL